MAYETKVILTLLANHIATMDTAKQAYEAVSKAASVEGLTLKSFEEVRKEFAESKLESKEKDYTKDAPK